MPAAQDVLQPQQQLARLEGLGDIVVDAGLQALDAVLGLGPGGQHADRNVGDRLEVAGKLEAALARHHDVEDDDVEGQAAHGRARGAASVAVVTRKPFSNR